MTSQVIEVRPGGKESVHQKEVDMEKCPREVKVLSNTEVK